MCSLCTPISRRAFCGSALTLPLTRLGHRPPGAAPLLEPALRLTGTGTATSTGTGSAAHIVAVTLDCCPGHFDERIAAVLINHNIPATLFLTAIWMRQNPAALALLKAHPDIFSLQNHGAQHLPPVLGSDKIFGLTPAGSLDAIRAEVLNGAAAITAATGQAPNWYRGAAALYSPAAIPFIESLGFRIAGFSLNADEGASLPAATVAARISAATNNDVIEGHINQPSRASGAGIAAGLIALQQSGTRFIHLTEITT